MKTLIERFEVKFTKTDNSLCWEWTANKNNKGYGMFYPGYGKNKRLAHRISYELHVAPIPEGKHVLHICDNPGCVNPEHLFTGTHGDNMRDKEAKNRGNHVSLKGEQNASSILTEKSVISIRDLYSTGKTRDQLTAMFGVTYACIADIINNRSWTHLEPATQRRPDQITKLTADDVVIIREMINNGVMGIDIAHAFGVHKGTIYDIKHKRTWASI